MSSFFMPASSSACLQGPSVRSMISETRISSSLRLSFVSRCFGPDVVRCDERKIDLGFERRGELVLGLLGLLFETLKRNAVLRAGRSRCSLRSDVQALRPSALSMSSPPRCVSPAVDFTLKTPFAISRIEMSNVPPPRSYTATRFPSFFSKPYARAAAVGSLMIRRTSRPAILPAAIVAERCASLK